MTQQAKSADKTAEFDATQFVADKMDWKHNPEVLNDLLADTISLVQGAFEAGRSSLESEPLTGQPRSRILAAMKCANVDEAIAKWEAAESENTRLREALEDAQEELERLRGPIE